jgi:hypothetical protein
MAGRRQALFAQLPTAACQGYRNLRDPPSGNAAMCREYCEHLWSRFYPYADDGFVEDFAVHLHQRFWEMYVGATLLDAGHQITAPKPGPDFRLQLADRTVWIEAVAATPGKPGQPDSVPRYEPREGVIEGHYVPHDRIVLRCTAAIAAKFPAQYERHARMGLLGPTDCYVVAVNHAEAYHWAEVGMPPYMLRAVLGLGAPFVTFDRTSRQLSGGGIEYRGRVNKTNGSAVETSLFLSEDSSPVTAVIGSVTTIGTPVHLQQAEHHLGQDFLLVRNPLSRTPLPEGLLRRGEEVTVILRDNEFSVSGRLLEQ